MNNQKSRNKSDKNIKNISSQQNLAKFSGGIKQEIDSLKKQINKLRIKKENKVQLQNEQLENHKKNKHKKIDNKDQEIDIQLQQINYKAKDKRLKLNIQINKLRRSIAKGDKYVIAYQINTIFSQINLFNQEIWKQNEKYADLYNIVQKEFDQYLAKNDYQVYKEKYKSVSKLNKKLQNQLMELRHRLTLGLDLQLGNRECMDKFQNQYGLIVKQNEQLAKNNVKFRDIVAELNNDIESKTQQLKVFEKSIEKKESQILLIHQEMNYLKIQLDRLKVQNSNFQKELIQIKNLNRQIKQQDKLLLSEIDILKTKIKKQQQLRLSYDQKIQKLKIIQASQQSQNQELRKKYDLISEECKYLNKQLNQEKINVKEIKAQLGLRIKQSNSLHKNVEQVNQEVQNLYVEIQSLKKANENYKDLYMKTRNRDYKESEQKSKTYQQIQNMIREHKKFEY